MQKKSKMKLQKYDGKEDLEEYLTHFELISERNNWGYKSRSLYLAAEVFRSELQTRVKGRNESIPELAQSIKKLTRKAYPSDNLDVTKTLALDYFIDAIPFKEIRIRLSEVSPKTVAEAENVAVRLDAVHIADRSRNCNVKTVGVETATNDLSTKIDEVIKKTDRVSNEVETLKSKETRSQ
ncbi:unnamed protein product [Mytilus coruscus]|uniref:Uncharacterized protein n=1 Tax=Mytilus coruscus TaxID=42192 RepID=A0A6J8F1B6_MYTCO|nr:unnamed protein product [Mytilus coruscus]